MIALTCSKCQTTLPVPENKLGTRIFVCPICATPLEAPAPAPAAAPAASGTSEDETVAPDAAQAYVQDKLRQIAEKRAAKAKADAEAPPPPEAEAPTMAPPLARPVAKKSAIPISLMAIGGIGIAGAAAVGIAAIVFLFMTRADSRRKHELDAAEKIAEIKPLDLKTLAVDELAKAVTDGPADARKDALKELGARGLEARAALAPALEVLKDPDPATRRLAQEAIARMGPPLKAEVPLYAAALRAGAPALRAFAAGQLAELGLQAQSELLFLRVLALDENALVQAAAQNAVLRIEDNLILSLMVDLQNQSAAVRNNAARQLAEMGARARTALPNLVEALADKNSAVRLAALDAFVAIGPDAVMVLGEALRDKNAEVRLAAINALGRVGADARFVMPELIAVAAGADLRAREEAQRTLARIGDYAVPYLVQALEREKNAVKQKPLIEALERMGPAAGPALQAALKSATPEAVKAAAPALAKIEAQAPPPPRPKDHVGPAGAIQNELRDWFKTADANHDGFLDKHELARAIRGAAAQAFDFVPAGKNARQFGPRDFAAFPDFAFLSRLDRNNDGKISRAEFEHWAYDHADVLRKDKEDRERIHHAQHRLMDRSLSPAARTQAEAQLAKLQTAYHHQRIGQDSGHRDINQMQWLQRPAKAQLPRK